MPSRRPERISGLLLQAVSEILLREVKDPRVHGVTLTAASISPDLKEATVFFRILHNNAPNTQEKAEDDTQGEQTDVEAGLRSAAGYIRRQIATRLRLRRTPQIRFQYDTTLDQANHMESLLQQARTMSTIHSEQEQQKEDSECPE